MSLLLASTLTSCSNLDFARGPVSAVGDAMDSGKAYVESNEADIAAEQAERLAKVLKAWEEQKGKQRGDYTMGVDDILAVSVLSLERPDEKSVLTREVTVDGTIELPLIENIEVKGLTAREAAAKIQGLYAGKYLKDPQVTVDIAKYQSAVVVITGAVQQPGIHYLRQNVSSVLEALTLCGGLNAQAGDTLTIVRGGHREELMPETLEIVKEDPDKAAPPAPESSPEPEAVEAATRPTPGVSPAEYDRELTHLFPQLAMAISGEDATDAPPIHAPVAPASTESDETAEASTSGEDKESAFLSTNVVSQATPNANNEILKVDLRRLIIDGDIRENLDIHPGDLLTVAPREQNYIYVLGYAARPGPIQMRPYSRVTALNALAMAGGLSKQGRAEKCYVIRETESGGRKIIQVNLSKTARGIRPSVLMEAGDTLVVGTTAFMKIMEFFNLGGSAGVNYNPLSPVP